MIFRQLKVGGFDSNFSYIVADELTKEAVVVDPCGNLEEILESIKKEKLKVKYIVNTHGHSDHTEGNKEMSSITGAKIVCHEEDAPSVNPDIKVKDGDILRVGNLEIRVIHTPGHTPGSICLLVENILLTGDTLFVGYCGRADGPGGSAEKLYHSLFCKIGSLPDDTLVYPGHDYGKKPFSKVGYEKAFNPYYKCKSKEEFIILRKRGV